jgi:hypothetical protein
VGVTIRNDFFPKVSALPQHALAFLPLPGHLTNFRLSREKRNPMLVACAVIERAIERVDRVLG